MKDKLVQDSHDKIPQTDNDEERPESIVVGTERTEPYLRTLEKRENTRGGLAWLVTGTLCFTVVVYLALTIFSPTRVNGAAFERIWFVLSPLVGLSVAHYFSKV